MRLATEDLVPLHNTEAEMSVLGSMLLREQAVEEVLNLLRDEDFYLPPHREVFRAINDLYMAGSQVDLVTLRNKLLENGKLQMVGGEDYLIQIAEIVPSSANAAYYAGIVFEKAILRRLDDAGHNIAKIARAPELSSDEKLDQAERAIFRVTGERMGPEFTQIQTLAKEVMVDVDTLVETGEPMEGTMSGFYDLDSMTTGFYPGEMTIIAARPSMGKTSLVLNIALNVARKSKGNVAIFSLEMSGKQLTRRIASMLSRVNGKDMKRPDIRPDVYRRISEACEVMYDLPIFIDESSDITGLTMRQKCRRLKRDGGLSLVVVDYLQLMRADGKTENRVNEIGQIARSLKALSKDLEVPVIALSQLSRRVEERENKRPMLSDLRDSGSIEAEADLVMFIHREDYYKDREKPEEASHEADRTEIAEILIQKHRNGPTGTVKLGFQPTYANFVNVRL